MDTWEIETNVVNGGGELTIAGMDENSRMEIGRKTYRFVRRLMRDPEMKQRIRERAAQIRAEEELAARMQGIATPVCALARNDI